MPRKTLFPILLLAALGAFMFVYLHENDRNPPLAEQAMTIEQYVTENIATLSPEHEVLGGKFHVTSIEAHGGAGTVHYEDGHIDLVADFAYAIDDLGVPNVTSFRVKNAGDGREGGDEPSVILVAESLHVPWSMAFLPSGELLATERNGILRVIGKNSFDIKVPNVVESGEGGLLGLALHPDFVSNKFVYLYFTARSGGKTINRVVRYAFDGTKLSLDKMILDAIPGGTNHNGGRIVFGPDGLLYITTGDSGNSDLAQNKDSLAGKILRLQSDGSIPKDNPFGTAVYSYGHRNPQGLAWDDEGNLWETEHGRSGLQSGLDEVNLIEKGANYGWPEIEGNESRAGMKGPILQSGSTTTWAPSGIAFRNGKIYFAGLRGEALYETEVISRGKLGTLKVHFKSEYGRLRGVSIGPDNKLYVTTSNQDGRGTVRKGDDKILKLSF